MSRNDEGDLKEQEQGALHLEKPGSKKREVKQQIRGTLSIYHNTNENQLHNQDHFCHVNS